MFHTVSWLFFCKEVFNRNKASRDINEPNLEITDLSAVRFEILQTRMRSCKNLKCKNSYNCKNCYNWEKISVKCKKVTSNVKRCREMWNGVTNVKSYTVTNVKLLVLHIYINFSEDFFFTFVTLFTFVFVFTFKVLTVACNTQKGQGSGFLSEASSSSIYEPPHDKTNKMTLRPSDQSGRMSLRCALNA